MLHNNIHQDKLWQCNWHGILPTKGIEFLEKPLSVCIASDWQLSQGDRDHIGLSTRPQPENLPNSRKICFGRV